MVYAVISRIKKLKKMGMARLHALCIRHVTRHTRMGRSQVCLTMWPEPIHAETLAGELTVSTLVKLT